MSDALTNVTVEKLSDDTYGCVLNLIDFFEGGEQPIDIHDHDLTLKRDNGEWQTVGTSKITLNEGDLQNLGKAIEATA